MLEFKFEPEILSSEQMKGGFRLILFQLENFKKVVEQLGDEFSVVRIAKEVIKTTLLSSQVSQTTKYFAFVLN